MEEVRGSSRFGSLALKTPPQLVSKIGKLQDAFWTDKNGYSRTEKPPSFSCQSLDILGRPISAMEYLSRSWSPAASDFMNIFSSNNLLIPLESSCILGKHEGEQNENYKVGEHDGESETEETKESTLLCKVRSVEKHTIDPESKQNRWSQSRREQTVISRVHSLRTLFAIEGPQAAFYQKHRALDLIWNLKDIKGWLRGKPLTGLFNWYKEKKKEELRLRTAKVDAALSVARLASAIAGITGSSVIAVDDANCRDKWSKAARDNNMGNVLSFAAALLAAVCGEAAESTGAPRDHVAFAINSGFATQTPDEIMTLTATAATCLRGAATLRSRTVAGSYLEDAEVLLSSGNTMPVVTPSGQKRQRLVAVQEKHKQPILILTRKYLGKLLTSKEYGILDMGETHEARGYYLLSLQTDGGDVKLLFRRADQALAWTSTICSCLRTQTINGDKHPSRN